MQKTFLKFIVFELIERIARFRLLLEESADSLMERAPALYQQLLTEAIALESQILEQKTAFNRLFSDQESIANGKAAPSISLAEGFLDAPYARLCQLSELLTHFRTMSIEPETLLFLKDALPEELLRQAGEQSVFLVAEGEDSQAFPQDLLPSILLDTLSILQKNNPLGWLGLMRAYAVHLLKSTSTLESLKMELLKGDRKKGNGGTMPLPQEESLIEAVFLHAIHLRLAGPAYYFYSLSEAIFQKDQRFLSVIEPALFFGLNHQNFTHKSWVILHEACERSKTTKDEAFTPLSEESLAAIYRAVEKVVPTKFAFEAKNLERAVQLQDRLSRGVLSSSSPRYAIEDVAATLEETRQSSEFSIYEPLAMMTEHPHTPREIVNAGWLHKVERGPVWLYSALNEEKGQGFQQIITLLNNRDSLLQKSIEVSEVHRVLLCSL